MSLAVVIGLQVLVTLISAGEPYGTTTVTDPTWHLVSEPRQLRIGKLPASPASTQSPDPHRIQRLEDQLADLQRRLTAAEHRSTYAVPVESGSFQASYVEPGQIQIEPECLDCQSEYSLTPSGQVFESEYPTLQWSGFLQLDTGWVMRDSANSEAIGDIDSKTGLRRVRLRVEGDIRRDSSYLVDLDFAASEFSRCCVANA